MNNKKLTLTLLLIAFGIFFTSCDDVFDIFNGYEIVEATETKTWNYNSTYPIFEVDSSVLKVDLNNVPSEKTLYLAKVNTGDATLPSSDVRHIVGASGRSAATIETLDIADFDESSLGLRKHFVGEKLPAFEKASSRSALSVPAAPNLSVTPISGNVGEEKDIYVDTDAGMKNYSKKKATLRAAGTNCYVWVLNDYFTSGNSVGNKVNTAVAENFAEKFDEIYPIITNVFGKESNKIYNYDTKNFESINTYSPTGEKINIVIYDLGNDYENENNISKNGVLGYFYAKDYYYSSFERSDIVGKSNVGKYFYIDSAYAVSNFNDTISTLAHEFQHMVNFNQKNVIHDVSPSTSYNEMLSMLCEDMMQSHLGLDDSASPKNRIQGFNAYYYKSGILEYRDGNYAALSYATSYAFGSWLARQYGGAKLVKEISTNAYVDNDSIVKAVNTVNTVNNKSFTFDDLFQQFLLALTKSTIYTHNKTSTQNIGSYSYSMKAFNLWSTYSNGNYTFKIGEIPVSETQTFSDYYKNAVYNNSNNWTGPLLFNNNYGPNELRPKYGISLHGIKSTSESNFTVTFSNRGADTLKMYLIIQ